MLLFSGLAAAEELNYRGAIKVEINAESFLPGETLEAAITAVNSEDFPLADSHIVIYLVKGGEFYYPPQAFDADNVFVIDTIQNVNLPAKGFKTFNYSYVLPEDLLPGSYRMDVYFRNKKTFIAGIPHLFASPQSSYFTVEGTGEYPQARIMRTLTLFEGVEGMISFPIQGGDQFEAKIVLKNTSSQDLSNLELFVGLCDWDDTRCDKFSPQTTETLDLKADEQKELMVAITAPVEPSAYAIRMELKDSSGRLLSLFRNRAIVIGPTRKIKKIYTDNYYYKSGEQVTLHTYTGPAPDHYTDQSVLEGADLKISVTNLKSGSSVFQESVALLEDWQSNDFQFTASKELSLFEVCGEVVKASQSFDKYCYTVDADAFSLEELGLVSATWNFDSVASVLDLTICADSIEGFPENLDASFEIREARKQKLITSGSVSGYGCIQKQIPQFIAGNYVLGLVNKYNNEKTTVEINALSSHECLQKCGDNNPCTTDGCSSTGCLNLAVEDGTECGPDSMCSAGTCTIMPDYFTLVLSVVAVVVLAAMAFLIYRRRIQK